MGEKDGLDVTIIGATGLRPSLLMDTSSPYCVCHIQGKPDTGVQTKHIDDTMDPVWDEQHRLFGYVPSDVIQFNVFDHDGWGRGKSDHLGWATLTGTELAGSGGGGFDDS